jgi:branched-subunit amino acid transport protein AzlD
VETNRILYLLGAIAVGWAVTYTLRALPFIIFGSKARDLPPWLERLGSYISPIIIFGLVIYSYSSLEWKTCCPYLAGLVTLALQLWRQNPLISIVAGTVVYMMLLRYISL